MNIYGRVWVATAGRFQWIRLDEGAESRAYDFTTTESSKERIFGAIGNNILRIRETLKICSSPTANPNYRTDPFRLNDAVKQHIQVSTSNPPFHTIWLKQVSVASFARDSNVFRIILKILLKCDLYSYHIYITIRSDLKGHATCDGTMHLSQHREDFCRIHQSAYSNKTRPLITIHLGHPVRTNSITRCDGNRHRLRTKSAAFESGFVKLVEIARND